VSDEASSAGRSAVGVVVTTPEDGLLHSELRLRHIARRRRDVAGHEEEVVFDAAATGGGRAGSVSRRSE